jgi:U32 family peptidase
MIKTELLAPAGNLDSAMAALENGADAVYCGLQEFSARKGAKNFNLEQISRLREWTFQNDKKIYITLNTIIKEDELPRMLGYLEQLEALQVDSIILQDPGLARIIHNHFPGLTLHGSTQMAVHNLSGLEILRELGFSRVVLPREMTMKEMAGFRKSMPKMELEVFIHGAQCYSFSGMCLASGMLLGRSANRGECGQICRNWFNQDKEKGYFLSSTDLWAGPQVLNLQEMGISSLKIEGRMKSPAYTAAVSRYYRAILDGKKGESVKTLEQNVRIAFSRQSGTGHLEKKKGITMVDRKFPGHRGLPLGEITSSNGKQIELHSAADLHKRDGLMFFDNRGQSSSFSLELKQSLKAGKVSLNLPMNAPRAGTMLYKVQSHDFHSKEFNENTLPLYKRSPDGNLCFSAENVELKIPKLNFSKIYPLESEESTGNLGPEDKIRAEFAKSAAYSFILDRLKLEAEQLDLSRRFFPPSRLKKIRQEIYKDIDAAIDETEKQKIDALEKLLRSEAESLESFLSPLPKRAALNPSETELPVFIPEEITTALPAELEGKNYYPLSPLIFPSPEGAYVKGMEKRLQESSAAENHVGIGNWGHIQMYRKWKSAGHKDLRCYGDTGMLLANSQAVLLMRELLGPGFTGAYGWIEADKRETPSPLTTVGKEFKPPLFISRACFKKHSLGGSCTGCTRNMEYSMTQKGQNYKVIIRNCLTWIFAAERGENQN